MTFPVVFHPFGWEVSAHHVFEVLAYATGFRIFLLERKRHAGAIPAGGAGWWLLAGCVLGAGLGSRLLAFAEHAGDPRGLVLGKTLVGGLLGGWIGIEVAKRRLGLTRSTGDAFVLPLTAGIAIGRVGCFLTGLADGTCGGPTSLPWGVDFGDGVPRHPAQVYEIAFVLAAGSLLRWGIRRPLPEGARFRLFLLAYLAFRLGVEFLKPVDPLLLGLSAIQWASLLGCGALVPGLLRGSRGERLAGAGAP